MSKYIKVTEAGKPPFVALRQNELFYKKRSATIEDPTQEEIEKYFPEEVKIHSRSTKDGIFAELEKVKEERNALQMKLDKEMAAHAKTKALLEKAKNKKAKNTEEDETT